MSNTDFEFGQITRADVKSIHELGHGMVNIGPGEEHMRVLFYWNKVLNRQKSREVGYPYYDKELFVKSHMPGEERLQENDRPATDEHKRRWPRQWAAFQQNREFVPDGAPIDYLFPDNPQIPAMLRYHGFHTVELLAKATPLATESIGMGMQDWINKAKRYLEDSRKGVDHHKIKELEERHSREIKALQNQIADLVSRLNNAATLANNVPTGQRPLTVPYDAPQVVKPMPQERQWAAPNPEFIDEEEEASPSPNPSRSERMKEMWRKKKAAQQET